MLNNFLLNTNGMTFVSHVNFSWCSCVLAWNLLPCLRSLVSCIQEMFAIFRALPPPSMGCCFTLCDSSHVSEPTYDPETAAGEGSGWGWDPGYCRFFSKQFLSHIAPNNYNSSYTCAQSQRPSNHHVLESERSFKPQGLSCPENWSPKLPNCLNPINKATEKQSAVISFVEGHALSKIFREGKEVEALRVLSLWAVRGQKWPTGTITLNTMSMQLCSDSDSMTYFHSLNYLHIAV